MKHLKEEQVLCPETYCNVRIVSLSPNISICFFVNANKGEKSASHIVNAGGICFNINDGHNLTLSACKRIMSEVFLYPCLLYVLGNI